MKEVKLKVRGLRAGEEVLINPERGFRLELVANASDLTQPWQRYFVLDELPEKIDLLRQYGGTVIQTYIYLSEYYDRDIPAHAISNINLLLDCYRAAGVKALLRFAYDKGMTASEGGMLPYKVQDVQRHIKQLSNVFERNKDVIFQFQSAFIGAWGEWHHSYYKHETYPEAVSAMMNTFFDYIPKDFQITFRHYEYKAMCDFIPERYARAGFHNGFFTLDLHEGAGGNDWTENSQDDVKVMEEGVYTHVDGEMPYFGEGNHWNLNFLLDGYDVFRRLLRHNYGAFSLSHNRTYNVESWKGKFVSREQMIEQETLLFDEDYFKNTGGGIVHRNCYDIIQDHLGYRYRLLEINVKSDENPQLSIDLSIQNDGISGVSKSRRVYTCILDANNLPVSQSSVLSGEESFDLKQLEWRGVGIQLTSKHDISNLTSGSYRIGIYMPDEHDKFESHSNAIRLANNIEWSVLKGINVIKGYELKI
ncbi:DUF4874 domain-containing protein [Vibrio paucivorans]